MTPRLMEVIAYLESIDCEPSKEAIKRVLNTWINNLYSHLGPEAHRHSLECGIADETGLSFEEQDALMLQQIKEYKDCLVELEQMDDENLRVSLLLRC